MFRGPCAGDFFLGFWGLAMVFGLNVRGFCGGFGKRDWWKRRIVVIARWDFNCVDFGRLLINWASGEWGLSGLNSAASYLVEVNLT